MDITRTQIEKWLRETDPVKLKALWQLADTVRRDCVGNAVHFRGLLEISNYCVRCCAYCGINVLRQNIPRYRMTADEIMEGVHKVVAFNYGTVVMQAGEDYGITREFISSIVRKIKAETSLAITLSLGERPFEDLQEWKEVGADRYLLRFETSDKKLYQLIHPSVGGINAEKVATNDNRDRLVILQELKQLGFEVGSGVMVGIPGQTYNSLVDDICLFRQLDLDMIGVGPYLPHPETPLGSGEIKIDIDIQEQVPNTELMTYKVLAITRLICPDANLPSVTALATLNKSRGRELGLQRGANIVMPNVTLPQYRVQYEIYPDKACVNETAEQCLTCLQLRIASIGRTIGVGKGSKCKNI